MRRDGNMDRAMVTGIVLHMGKGGAKGKTCWLYTKERGLLPVYMTSKSQGKNASLLSRPFSEVRCSGSFSDALFHVSQTERITAPGLVHESLETFVYTAIMVELVQSFCSGQDSDWHIYELLRRYGEQIGKKNLPVLTMIAGWNLISYLGYLPDLRYCRIYSGFCQGKKRYWIDNDVMKEFGVEVKEERISEEFRELWKSLLSYFKTGVIAAITRRQAAFLEQLLLDYAEQCAEKELNSRSFLDLAENN